MTCVEMISTGKMWVEAPPPTMSERLVNLEFPVENVRKIKRLLISRQYGSTLSTVYRFLFESFYPWLTLWKPRLQRIWTKLHQMPISNTSLYSVKDICQPHGGYADPMLLLSKAGFQRVKSWFYFTHSFCVAKRCFNSFVSWYRLHNSIDFSPHLLMWNHFLMSSDE